MEVVLPKMRISGKRSQDHQDEQQAKKAKMDIGTRRTWVPVEHKATSVGHGG